MDFGDSLVGVFVVLAPTFLVVLALFLWMVYRDD